MTNGEKAQEICEKQSRYNPLCSSLECYLSAIEMANWKDEQFNKILKRANEAVTKAHEEGAKIERERIIEKFTEFLYQQINEGDLECKNIEKLIEDFNKIMEE